MRKLKFRSWDNVAKKMFYSSQEQFDDMLGFRFEHFECCKPIYMQFTGLHDKNENEIYEGDVLQLLPLPVYRLVEVNEYDNQFGWELDGPPFCKSNCLLSIIIGNIYEHPHLLEKQNETN